MNSFVKDSLSVFSTRILLFVIGFTGGVIVARVLGPTYRGELSVVLIVPTILLSMGHLGIGNANLYFIGKKKFDLESIISNSFIISLILGSFLFALSYLFAFFLRNTMFEGISFMVMTLAFVTIPFKLLIKYSDYIFIGKQMISERNLLNIIEITIYTIGIVFFVLFLRANVKGVLISSLIGILAAIIYVLYHLNKIENLKFHLDINLFKASVAYGIKPFLALLIISLNYRLDILLIRLFLSNTEVGLYAVSVGIAEKLWFFPQALGLVTYSRVASLRDMDANELTPKVNRNSLLISIISIIVLLPLTKILVPLVYGKAYLPSVNPFIILLPGIFAMTAFKVLNSDLAGRGRPEIAIYVFSVSLIINIILNILFIPWLGIEGAALASTISYTISAFILVYMFSKITKVSYRNLLFPKQYEVKKMYSIVIEEIRKLLFVVSSHK